MDPQAYEIVFIPDEQLLKHFEEARRSKSALVANDNQRRIKQSEMD